MPVIVRQCVSKGVHANVFYETRPATRSSLKLFVAGGDKRMAPPPSAFAEKLPVTVKIPSRLITRKYQS